LSVNHTGIAMPSALSTAASGAASTRWASARAHANVIPFVPAQGIQIGELAVLAKVRKQSMAHSVELLTAAGYVVRRPDPDDGRASLIVLTDKGRALGPASRSAGQRVEADWAAAVGRDNVEHLRRTLMELLRFGTES
jgi:DNA-binding MarR family transcriptional regulator